MTESRSGEDCVVTPKAEDFARRLINVAAGQRVPELFSEQHPDALYYLPKRNGVSVIVLRTTTLTQEQRTKLLRYRLAQYLAVGFIDAEKVYEARLEHEPISAMQPNDVHYIAGSIEAGEILCYAALRGIQDAPYGVTLRTRERPLFPVEEDFGWGIFNRLPILPDLPINKVRELSRFVKSQQLHSFDELGTRAPMEIAVALAHTLTGSLRLEVDALIGDFEENVGKRNLDFFHLPMVVLPGMLPYGHRPSALRTVMRSIEIMQSKITTEAAATATILIEPSFPDAASLGLRQFSQGRRYIELGQAAAEAALPRIVAALPWLRG